MRNKKMLLIIILVIILVIFLLYKSNQDKFDLSSYPFISKEAILIDQNIYLGYGFEWNGSLSPEIDSIRLIKKDGLYLSKEDEQMSIDIYIDENSNIGSMYEEDIEIFRDEGRINFHSYINYKYKKDLEQVKLVLKIKVHDTSYENNLQAIEIKYKVLGIDYTQLIEYPGFINEE